MHPILINSSDSLPHRIFYLTTPKTYSKGNIVSFKHKANNFPITKIIKGVPGDKITISKRRVFINGKELSLAKTKTILDERLEIIKPGVIPPGYFYVHGLHPDSFDSRYNNIGLINEKDIIGLANPLF